MNYIKNFFKKSIDDFKEKKQKIDEEYAKKIKDIDERNYEFLNGNPNVKLSLLESFLYKIFPKIFFLLIICFCIIVGILGGIFYILITIIIFSITGYILFK